MNNWGRKAMSLLNVSLTSVGEEALVIVVVNDVNDGAIIESDFGFSELGWRHHHRDPRFLGCLGCPGWFQMPICRFPPLFLSCLSIEIGKVVWCNTEFSD